jgi:hypothetical protein
MLTSAELFQTYLAYAGTPSAVPSARNGLASPASIATYQYSLCVGNPTNQMFLIPTASVAGLYTPAYISPGLYSASPQAVFGLLDNSGACSSTFLAAAPTTVHAEAFVLSENLAFHQNASAAAEPWYLANAGSPFGDSKGVPLVRRSCFPWPAGQQTSRASPSGLCRRHRCRIGYRGRILRGPVN